MPQNCRFPECKLGSTPSIWNLYYDGFINLESLHLELISEYQNFKGVFWGGVGWVGYINLVHGVKYGGYNLTTPSVLSFSSPCVILLLLTSHSLSHMHLIFRRSSRLPFLSHLSSASFFNHCSLYLTYQHHPFLSHLLCTPWIITNTHKSQSSTTPNAIPKSNLKSGRLDGKIEA